MTTVPDLAAHAYFVACAFLGRLLRLATYSTTRIVERDGKREVQKFRSSHAPLLVWLGGSLLRVLDTGVRVLPGPDWHERERRLYWLLRGTSIRIEPNGTIALPCLPGRTLAALLEDGHLDPAARVTAVRRAVVALADFHRAGFTHGDAMAENVLVDLESGNAYWFDFETVHEPTRPIAWQRADDVRALLATCLLRTSREAYGETVQLVLDAYADAEVACVLASSFSSFLRRSLTFHLAQAGISLRCFREVGRLLRDRCRA